MATSCNSFPSSYRLKDRRDFTRLASRGRLFSTDHILIQWGKTNAPHARIGITVVRRFGSAVDRNGFRRRAKEAFRQSKLRNMPGIELNLRPKHSLSVSFTEFCLALEKFEKYLARTSSLPT